MSQSKAKIYSLEFKQSSAKLAAESNQSISQTAKELGVSAPALYGWISKYYPKHPATTSVDDAQAELKRLKKELARVKQERDTLKKAAAYFANETQ